MHLHRSRSQTSVLLQPPHEDAAKSKLLLHLFKALNRVGHTSLVGYTFQLDLVASADAAHLLEPLVSQLFELFREPS